MTTDELRAKFEAWAREVGFKEFVKRADGEYATFISRTMFDAFRFGHASRDAEVEALQDALFQISVRLKVEREPDMDDMSWHTDMIARAQYLANLEQAAMAKESGK